MCLDVCSIGGWIDHFDTVKDYVYNLELLGTSIKTTVAKAQKLLWQQKSKILTQRWAMQSILSVCTVETPD